MLPLVQDQRLLIRYRTALVIFMVGLILSGLTAFPLLNDLRLLCNWLGIGEATTPSEYSGFSKWILTVRIGLEEMHRVHPWIAYGTGWLAFAHLALAVFFIGPWIDPVRNVWVLKAGLVSCLMVLPLALICGAIRGIPLGWRLIDCSFGVFGSIPLLYCLSVTRQMHKHATA